MKPLFYPEDARRNNVPAPHKSLAGGKPRPNAVEETGKHPQPKSEEQMPGDDRPLAKKVVRRRGVPRQDRLQGVVPAEPE